MWPHFFIIYLFMVPTTTTLLYHLIQFNMGVTCDRPDGIINLTRLDATCDL